ncbi:MAG: hypothetical protein Alpg2KO_17610 [Alphaproteobacteria bacterium]
MITDLKLEELVIVTGRIPHEDVERYYSLVDIAPFPRKPFKVCETVSPLKPFEAMAMQKAVLVSDCAALVEIVEDNKRGLVFRRHNFNHFADQLERLIRDADLRQTLGEEARRWVCANRDWSHSAARVIALYDRLSGKEQS